MGGMRRWEQRGETKTKGKEETRWRLVVFRCIAGAPRHLVFHCHILSAAPSLPRDYLSSSIPPHICSLCHSALRRPPPPHSSQLKKTKRAEARGESKSRLSHGETERNGDGEQSERRFSFFLSCAKNAQGAACQMWGRPKEESQNDAQNVFFLNGKRQIVYRTPGGRILS